MPYLATLLKQASVLPGHQEIRKDVHVLANFVVWVSRICLISDSPLEKVTEIYIPSICSSNKAVLSDSIAYCISEWKK